MAFDILSAVFMLDMITLFVAVISYYVPLLGLGMIFVDLLVILPNLTEVSGNSFLLPLTVISILFLVVMTIVGTVKQLGEE